MNKLILLFVSSLLAGAIQAQSRTDISGIIVDAKDKPMKNIRLSILNSKTITKTNKDGLFTLNRVQPDDSVLILTNKRKTTRFLAANNRNIKLKIDKETIALIQESGDTIHLKLEITQIKEGSGIVTAEMINRRAYRSLQEVITEFVPSVRFENGSTGTEAIIRGKTSINMSSAAVVIVNGTEMTFDMANSSLDVPSIGTIEVNKSGSGYGLRGANGVIIITTK